MELSDWIKQLQVKDCLELAIKYTLREFRDTTHPSALHAAFREIKNLTEFDDCDYEADSIQVAYLYDFHAKRIHDSIQVLSMFRRITEESEQFIDFGCGCGANIVGIACYRDYLYSFEKEDHVRENIPYIFATSLRQCDLDAKRSGNISKLCRSKHKY